MMRYLPGGKYTTCCWTCPAGCLLLNRSRTLWIADVSSVVPSPLAPASRTLIQSERCVQASSGKRTLSECDVPWAGAALSVPATNTTARRPQTPPTTTDILRGPRLAATAFGLLFASVAGVAFSFRSAMRGLRVRGESLSGPARRLKMSAPPFSIGGPAGWTTWNWRMQGIPGRSYGCLAPCGGPPM